MFPLSCFVLDHLQTVLMTTDGCLGSTHYDACSNGFEGLFHRGLHAVTQQYMDWILEIVGDRISGPGALQTPKVGLLKPFEVLGLSCHSCSAPQFPPTFFVLALSEVPHGTN